MTLRSEGHGGDPSPKLQGEYFEDESLNSILYSHSYPPSYTATPGSFCDAPFEIFDEIITNSVEWQTDSF